MECFTVTKKKGLVDTLHLTLIQYGRCDRIRTYDPLHPMQVRYQAAPHTVATNSSSGRDAHCASALLRVK